MLHLSFPVHLASHLNISHLLLSSSRLSNTRCSDACVQCTLYLERYRFKKKQNFQKQKQQKQRNKTKKKRWHTENQMYTVHHLKRFFFFYRHSKQKHKLQWKSERLLYVRCALRVHVKDHKHIIWRRWFICLFISFIEFLFDRIHSLYSNCAHSTWTLKRHILYTIVMSDEPW